MTWVPITPVWFRSACGRFETWYVSARCEWVVYDFFFSAKTYGSQETCRAWAERRLLTQGVDR